LLDYLLHGVSLGFSGSFLITFGASSFGVQTAAGIAAYEGT
jgi:hypothetical protein